MSALDKAFSDTERSYCASKAAVSAVTQSLLAQGPAGFPSQRTDLSKAREQLQHFRGWVYTSIRPIAQRIAGQAIRVGRTKGPRTQKQAADVKPLV